MAAINYPRNSSIENLIQSIKPDVVEGYISTKNEYFKDYDDGVTSIYRDKKHLNLQLKIPLRPDYDDYTFVLTDVIKSIATLENKELWEIITNLKTDHPSDIIRYQLKGSDTDDGTAPLKSGANLYSGALDTIEASAFSIERPSRIKYGYLKSVSDLVEQCRIGQTEYGSYSVPLICPLFTKEKDSINFMRWDEKPDGTFTRKVTTHLMKSLNHIVEVISNDNTEQLIHPLKDDMIINSKMYVALNEMKPDNTSLNLNIKSDWLIEPPKEKLSSTISINYDYFKEIENVAEALAPEPETEIKEFVAKVHLLKDHLKQGHTYEYDRGQVGIVAIIPGGEVIRAKMTLTEEDYKKASNAHLTGKSVKIKGILKRGKRDHHITDIENFEII
jgi:hypothetical protein